VSYWDFRVDYFFIDSNIMDAFEPLVNPAHNLCGLQHNGPNASCGPQGPHSVDHCLSWFEELWDNQMIWLEAALEQSDAQWQIIVTHFPPYWGGGHQWGCLAERYGIDVFVSGHVHSQTLTGPMEGGNFLKGTTVLVSGGGGGITSEKLPDLYGFDDEYGFMHMTLGKDNIKTEAVTHSGFVRKVVQQKPRWGLKTGSRCIALEEISFAPVDGGSGRACRGQGGSDKADADFMTVQDVATRKACMQHCNSALQCTGIEYGHKVCKLWITNITESIPLDGFVCFERVRSLAQHRETDGTRGWRNATAPAIVASESVSTTMGKGRECRGALDSHDSWQFKEHTAPTLEGCERICFSTDQCQGIEYGPGTVCNIWIRPIMASVEKEGVVCIPAQMDVSGGRADLVESSGILHV